jgi:hypothetical protein
MAKVISPVAPVVLDSGMLTLIENAVQADAKVYGARIAFAVGVNNASPADCKWYALEGNGQKLPPVIQAIKDTYYAGLKGINYSNPSNAWKMIKHYAQLDAQNRCMFGEVAPTIGEVQGESESEGAGKTNRKPQQRLLEDLTAIHDYCMREIGKANPDFTDSHKVAHAKVMEALKALGKSVGI